MKRVHKLIKLNACVFSQNVNFCKPMNCKWKRYLHFLKMIKHPLFVYQFQFENNETSFLRLY